MPRFSVIVPAYKLQARLHACLESVLRQTYEIDESPAFDLEVIAVDAGSPDSCGEIIDEFAARDPRVTAVHLPADPADPGQGPGPARNAGLARATGDYVLFLDGDDTLAPHALRDIADRLKASGEPDVLVFGHARIHWSGATEQPPVPPQLTESGPASFQLAERPALLRRPAPSWNKAYRREFLEREGLAFPPGRHTDTFWSYATLLAASSLSTLERVCVHHRERRGPAVARGRYFDLFPQYDRVFGFLDSRPELGSWRPVLARRMADHLAAVSAAVLTAPGLSARTRAEFFRLARAHYGRHRVPGAAGPRHAGVRFGTYRTYRVLRGLRALRAHGRAFVSALVRPARTAALRLHYRVQRSLPLREDLAVFSAYRHRGYACSPAAIEAKLRELAPGVRTAWVTTPEYDTTVPAPTRRLRPGGFAYFSALARAKYLVNNGEFDHRLVKRPGQILLQTHHGTPLKTVGLDLMDRPAASHDIDFARLLADADKWDFALSANRHATLAGERAFPAAYTTLEYGSPRNDVLRRAADVDSARLRDRLGIPGRSTVVLYAPTYRDYSRSRHLPLDLERLGRALGPEFFLLTRAHHAYGAPLNRAPLPRVLDVTGHPSVEELLLVADALVTDYSSLMFDYANLDRPIVILDDDREAYEAARGTYFDLRGGPPGAVARTEDELIDIFTTGHWRGSRSAQLRAAFRARFCPYDDGHAAERVVRRVFLGNPGLPQSGPALPEQRTRGTEFAPAATDALTRS
ncbi:glycosyl transferase [Streptomyces sp. CB01201]|uniref:bifunctional glycosyltransferase/CDP-glycerol:glycerophosphate glycerophosphotransferase n=1 Tax=Streptomyces sp. CB01201 TaxID=2020324 RepID=UPI000C27224D|nr:bifunctional glycosyltransferase family 2 protein/CDP-glycerol:glycerophosphate glycerophosphotransferase [Streptomyces sp. CB01201]PJM99370.1 glycosyl transferase [Streptomyces sp. CB01201]